MEGPELAKLHKRIIQIWKDINRCWKIIDAYEEQGILPDHKKQMTLKEFVASIKNVPTKISRLNRLLKNVKSPKKIEKYNKEKSTFNLEMHHLNEILNKGKLTYKL